ncbi:fructosamine kinase family protein [Anaerolineales bacterium]
MIKLGKGTAFKNEAWMLEYLQRQSSLSVPEVDYADDHLMIMTYIEGNSQLNRKAQIDAAGQIARLHQIKGSRFGLSRDTVIGGLKQVNTETDLWIPFFREQRLIYMAKMAHQSGKLNTKLFERILKFAEDVHDYIQEAPYPALIHGDLWTGNILQAQGKIVGFLDPAIYYAHPEIELAFSTLFHTFDQSFFETYQQINPIEKGFFEVRRDIYNLYPLLVHVCLFGQSYASSIESILSHLGY